MFTSYTNKVLVCVYTHKGDHVNLEKLKRTAWYLHYSKLSNFTFIDFYGDSINSGGTNNSVILEAEDDYSKLSIKTIKMVEYSVNNIDFDFLVKIDSSIVSDAHVSSSNLFSFDNFIRKFNSNFFNLEYNGYVPILRNTFKSFRSWAASKKLAVMPEILFQDIGLDMWPNSYWGGKCYSISLQCCHALINNKPLFYRFKELMGGCEDLCVGTVLRKEFINHHG
jgi:hypothetical protein